MWPFQKKSIDAATLAAIDAFSDGYGGVGGFKVTPNQAFGVAAVFAAVRVISEDVAKLPAKLKKPGDNGDVTATKEPEHTILNSVGMPAVDGNDGFTAMEWIEAIVASAAFRGIGAAYLNRVGGRVREIQPIPFDSWKHERGVWSVKWEGKSAFEKVSRENLFVLRGPQLGLNVSTQARQAIGLAIEIDKLMNSLARKSGRPNGIVSTQSLDSPEKAQTLVDRFKKYFGSSGEGGLMPLDLGDIKFHRISLTPDELQIKDTRHALIEQIASAFRVQPARLMHEMGTQSYASAYQWNIAHVSDTIQPWVKRFCQSFNKDVLGRIAQSGLYCHIELKGLLAGSPKERAEYHLKMRMMQVSSPKSVAQIEDLPTDRLSDDPATPLLTNPNPEKEKSGEDDE